MYVLSRLMHTLCCWAMEKADGRCCLVPCVNGQVRTLTLDYREAAGPCWARHLAQV